MTVPHSTTPPATATGIRAAAFAGIAVAAVMVVQQAFSLSVVGLSPFDALRAIVAVVVGAAAFGAGVFLAVWALAPLILKPATLGWVLTLGLCASLAGALTGLVGDRIWGLITFSRTLFGGGVADEVTTLLSSALLAAPLVMLVIVVQWVRGRAEGA